MKTDIVRLKVNYNTHDEIILENRNGDCFYFDPTIHDELLDFLSGCEVIDE